MRFLTPVGPVGIIEGFGAEELAVEDFRLVLYVVLDLRLVRQVVIVFANGEIVVLNCLLGLRQGCWNEILLIYFAHGLSKLVTYDVAIADLLVDSRVMNQGAIVGN